MLAVAVWTAAVLLTGGLGGGGDASGGSAAQQQVIISPPAQGRRYQSPFSVEELLNLVIPSKTSQDLDLDPCKNTFLDGDIVLPGNHTHNHHHHHSNHHNHHHQHTHHHHRQQEYAGGTGSVAGGLRRRGGGGRGTTDGGEEFDVRDTMSEPRMGGPGFWSYELDRQEKHKYSQLQKHTYSKLKHTDRQSLRRKSQYTSSVEGKTAGGQKGGDQLTSSSSSTDHQYYSGPKLHPDDQKILQSADQSPVVTNHNQTADHLSTVLTNQNHRPDYQSNDLTNQLSGDHYEAENTTSDHDSNNSAVWRQQRWKKRHHGRVRGRGGGRLAVGRPGHSKQEEEEEVQGQTAGRFHEEVNAAYSFPGSDGRHIRHRRSKRRHRDRKVRRRAFYSPATNRKRKSPDPSSDHMAAGKTREKRAATARPERIWDYAVIPYEIDSNFSGIHKALFKQAMRHWENFTCIQFVERTPEHPNWIVFTERPCGCCSFVGKRGNGPQAISIGKNCDKFGIVVHELGHVVGFWHEHTRPDRDNWVTIIRENVILGQEYNFNKLTGEEVNSLGLRYDYDSIMHYARNTFSKGTYLDTILPRSDLPENQGSLPEIGQRIRLSKGDILQTSALYSCPVCGKTYQDTVAKFGSPQYTLYNPPPGVDIMPFKKGDLCQWRILATHGEKIILNITSLDIPASVNCQLDYLEVRDGYWHKSPLLAKLCGNALPAPIISTGSRLMLSYKTHDLSPDHMGFTAQYEAVCGGELAMERGQLESPNFPEEYQPNKECIWRISVPEEFQVALKFQSFEIENHDNCVYDYLEIRDGDSSVSPLVGTYCGYKMPKDIKSSTNSLWIKFVSDGSVQKAGFSASFMKEYDECHSPDHGCEHECINTLGGYKCSCRLGYELHSDEKRCENACGGLIDTANGTITSPSFPDIYPSNKNCIWEIIAPPQWRITINFTHFDIEGNNQDCEYDSLSVSSKMGSGEARQHGLFCGNRLPPVITSEGNSLRLEFLSDNSVQKNGFAAIFFTDKDECATDNGGCQHVCRNTIGAYYCSCHQGFVLHENGHDCKEGGCKHEISTNRGEISSPHFPDFYPAKKECVWIFSTTAGHRIKLLFTEFELEPHQECAYDHIVVYDGLTTSQQILGRFCGSKLPHPLIATESSMLLVFKSDASVQRKGFMAEHVTVCGGHLEADETPNQIFSHSKFGDVNYDNKEDCDWIIEAPQGRYVHLSFVNFELEEEQDCGYDFIEVFAGYDDSGPSYGRFCGNTSPPEIVSVDEALLLRFKSDDTINSKGFSATYVIIDHAETKDYDYPEKKEAALPPPPKPI